MRIKSQQFHISFFHVFLMASLFFVSVRSVAQDKIYKKGGEVLEVKILEISPNEVKYQVFSDPEGPIYVMDKDRIVEIIFKNGRVEKYVMPLSDEELYIGQKKQAIKLNFLSPLLGYTQLAYEKNQKPGRSYEISLGIIGLGQNQEMDSWSNFSPKENQIGAFASFGFKFIKIPNFTTNNQKYSHILQGSYVKPEVMLGHFNKDVFVYSSSSVQRQKTTFGAIMVNLGRQWVFSEIFLLDVYGGLGYAFKNEAIEENIFNDSNRFYGVIAGDRNPSLAISGGFRIGILLQ